MKDKEARERIDALKRALIIETSQGPFGFDYRSYRLSSLEDKISSLEAQYRQFNCDRLDSFNNFNKLYRELNDRIFNLECSMTELTKNFSLLINHLGLEFEDKKAELIIKKKAK